MSIPNFIKDLKSRSFITVVQEQIITGRAAPDDTEYWHVVGAAGEVGFIGGWNNVSGGNPLSFRKDDSGFVHLRGLIQGPANNGQIFQLPASWAPPYLAEYPVLRTGLVFGEVQTLYVHTNGVVEVLWPVAGTFNNIYFLDNYRWRAA